jgi:restriction endonuclease Mrr
MARKRKQDNSILALLAIGVCFYAVTTIGNSSDAFLSTLADNVAGLQIGIAAATVVIVLLLTVLPRLARQRVLRKATQIVDDHAHQLAKRRAQLIRQDAYGKELRDKWHHEVAYFLSEHIRSTLNAREQSILDDERNLREMAQRIETVADAVDEQSGGAVHEFSPSMSPTAYETLCAEELRQHGWDARLTPTTGDQGVDVIAEKSGTRVVLQCKLYSSSVGNAAVQEIVAAKAYERSAYAVVVSNSPYTSAAQQLARANNVLLLHHNELWRLETLLDIRAVAATASVEPAQSQGAVAAAIVSNEVAVLDGPLSTVQTTPERPQVDSATEKSVEEENGGGVLARVIGFWKQLPLGTKAILALLVALIIVDASANLYINRSEHSVAGSPTYSNSRFGYRINYPSTFATPTESPSADGMTTGDGTASLALSGANNENGGSTRDYYEAAVSNAPGRIGYKKLGGTWFVVTYDTSDVVVYEKMFVGSGSLNAFVLSFPKSQRSKYDPIVTMIEKSFRHGDVRHQH